jgi:dihydroorotase
MAKKKDLDLLIKGGKVLDPISGLEGPYDIGIRGEQIARVEEKIPRSEATSVLEAKGSWVFPGLVDFHCHVFWPGTMVSVEPDPLARKSGVMTLIDGGSAGSCNFPFFRRSVIEPSSFRILAFLNISCIGIATEGMDSLTVKELDYGPLAHLPSAISTIEENRDLIVGVKMRAYHGLASLAPLALARQVADQVKLPLMVHLAPSPPSIREILPYLREGDILTHIYHPGPGGLIDSEGKVRAEFLEARKRGIWMDVGLAQFHSDFSVIEGALGAGFLPDIISTDLSSRNVKGLVVDLPTTLSKFLNFGLSVEEALPMVTRNPLFAAGQENRIKGLKPGEEADIAIFRWADGPVTFQDYYGHSLEGQGRLAIQHTVRKGKLVES